MSVERQKKTSRVAAQELLAAFGDDRDACVFSQRYDKPSDHADSPHYSSWQP